MVTIASWIAPHGEPPLQSLISEVDGMMPIATSDPEMPCSSWSRIFPSKPCSASLFCAANALRRHDVERRVVPWKTKLVSNSLGGFVPSVELVALPLRVRRLRGATVSGVTGIVWHVPSKKEKHEGRGIYTHDCTRLVCVLAEERECQKSRATSTWIVATLSWDAPLISTTD